jgi:hypothetical protein
MRLFSKINTAFFTLKVLLLSGYVRFALSFLPHSVVKKMMGPVVEAEPVFPVISKVEMHIIKKLVIAIARVKRIVPWNMECYTQALTAKIILKKYSIPTILLIGFRKDDTGKVQGHAWLKYDQQIITGYAPDLDSYALNGRFF